MLEKMSDFSEIYPVRNAKNAEMRLLSSMSVTLICVMTA